MYELITANPFPLLGAALALALYASYRLGQTHGLTRVPQVCERPHVPPVVDPYEGVVPGWDVGVSEFVDPLEVQK